MEVLAQPWIRFSLTPLLAAGALFSIWRGQRILRRGMGNPEHPSQTLWVVRGIRGLIVGAGLASWAFGVFWASKGFLIFGAIFLGEELLETGIMIWALRRGEKASRIAK